MNLREIPTTKIILISSVALLFLAFTVYILNLAQGRQFGTDGQIVDTSILRINSSPDDVAVFINGQQFQKTENRVEGIPPGEITIKLEKEGFAPWEKTITLEARVVKDISAQLFPLTLNFSQFTNSNIDRMFFGDNPEFLFYTITDSELAGEAGIWKVKLNRTLLDFGGIEPQKVADFNENFISLISKGYEIEVSPDNNRLIFKIPNDKSLYIYDANNKNSRINLISILGYYPEFVSWLSGSSSLIIEQNGLMFEYDINSNQSIIVYFRAGANPVFSKSAGTVYFIREDNKLIYRYVGRASETLELPDNFQLDGKVVNIYSPAGNSDLVFFKTPTSLFFLDLEINYFAKITENNDVVAISASGLDLIVKSGDALSAINLEESADQTKYSVKTSPIAYKLSELDSIYFTTNSNMIVHLKRPNALNDVIFMDNDGKNPKKVVNNQDIENTRILLTSNLKDIYLLLRDESKAETDPKILKNIYKVSLDITE